MFENVKLLGLAVFAGIGWVLSLNGGQADEKARLVEYFKTYKVEQLQTAVKKTFKGTVRLEDESSSYVWLEDPYFAIPDKETLFSHHGGMVATVNPDVLGQLIQGTESPMAVVAHGQSEKSDPAIRQLAENDDEAVSIKHQHSIQSGLEEGLRAFGYGDRASHYASVLEATNLSDTLVEQENIADENRKVLVEFRAPLTWSYALKNPDTKYLVGDHTGVGNRPASTWKYGVEQTEDAGGYLVVLRLNDPEQSLKSGEQVTVAAQVPMSWNIPKAPSVPRSSVKTRSDGSTTVMVVTRDEGEMFVKETRVRILNSAGSRHQVAGLPRGTTLIAEKVDQMEDGQLLIDLSTLDGRPHSEEFLLNTLAKF
ncbi:MAG: hypothetical protein AAGA97_01125 [Pseudomonadota bacterium]